MFRTYMKNWIRKYASIHFDLKEILDLGRDKFIFTAFAISIILIVLSIFVGFTNFIGINGKLVMNYDILGNPILGDIDTIGSIIAILSAVIIMNFFLIYITYSRDKFFAYTLSFANVGISVLVLGALFGIGSFN